MPVCDLIQFAHLDNFRNFDFKAIMVLMKKKKKDKSTLTSLIFLFSLLPIDSSIRHGCCV